MKKKLLTGLIVLLVIAAAFFLIMLTASAAIAAWIYMTWMVWKKGIQIFHKQMEPKLAKRRLKIIKTSLLVAAISFIGGIVGIVVHNATYAATETEETVFFWIALSTIWLFVLATGSGLAIFLKGRQKHA